MMLEKLIKYLKTKLLFVVNFALLILFSTLISFSVPIEKKLFNQLETQLEIQDFLGAKKLSEKIYKTASSLKLKEFAFLTYWVSSGYLHFHKGQFHQILEDIGGLNLYWSFFKRKRLYEDLYYEYLGDLYFLLFQYRRAIIFYLQAYKRKVSQERLLKIILATELSYYNELIPYKNFSFIENLLNKVRVKKLSETQKKLYNFEWALYFLMTGKYSKALQIISKYRTLEISFLTKGQEYFFLGKIYEFNKKYKQAFFFYQKALKFVKHPINKENILLHLFITAGLLGYSQEANTYYLSLTKFGGIEVNPYLQIATLKIYKLDNFLKKFFWKPFYKNLIAKILWLNINNSRGIKAFEFFLNDFLNSGVIYPDFLIAWKILLPYQVKELSFTPKKLLSFSLKKLKQLLILYTANPILYNYLFKDYGILALAKYFFLQGDWQKAFDWIKKVKISLPEKKYIRGVIEAYKGKPYFLEENLKYFPQDKKLEAYFWLGWGYLLNNHWNLTSLYWEDFLKKSQVKPNLLWEKLFAAYYLGLHYESCNMPSKAIKFYAITLKLLKKTGDFQGLKKFIVFRLISLGYPIKNIKISINQNWVNLMKKVYNP